MAQTTGYVIKATGEPYSGLILEYGGRLVTTQTGTYEGYFSKTLTIAPQSMNGSANGNGQTPPPGNGQTPPPGANGGNGGMNGNGGIIIDDPGANNQQQNQGGGGY